MKEIDRYYYFIFNAYSSAIVGCEYNYYVDILNNKLVKIRYGVEPEKGLIQLPKLNIEERKKLLRDYIIERVEDVKLKFFLNHYLEELNIESDFNILNKLKNNGFLEGADEFDMFFGNKVTNGAIETYKKYNLKESMEVIVI